MKVFYIILLIFFVSIGVAFAQENTDLVYQVVAYSADGTKQSIAYSYDDNGKQFTKIVEEYFDEQAVCLYRYVYNYNSNEDCITSFRENFLNGKWVDSTRYSCIYDSNSNPISSLSEKWEKGNWVFSSRSKWTYDSKHNLLEYLSEEWNGGWFPMDHTIKSWDLDGNLLSENCIIRKHHCYTNTYTYDKNGNQLTSVEEDYFGVESITKTYSTYDINDKIIIKIIDYNEFDDHNNMSSIRKYTYDYDSNGNQIVLLCERWYGEKWENSWRRTSTYDLNGKIIILLMEVWDGEKWENDGRTTTTYDSNGNILILLIEKWNGQKWENNECTTSTYDSNGKILILLIEKWDGEKLGKCERTTTTYEKNGKILEIYTEVFENGVWVNSERENTYYDINGNTVQMSYEKWVDKQWTNADKWLEFMDSNKHRFAFNCYKVEIKYKGDTPVKDETTVSGYSLNCSPNPSAGPLNINYTLTKSAIISISISNMLGIEMANISDNQFQLPGNYNLNYDASNLPPGAYFITIKAGNMSETRKIIIND